MITMTLFICFAFAKEWKTVGPMLFVMTMVADYFIITETAKIIWGQP